MEYNGGFNWNHQSEDNELMIVWRIMSRREDSSLVPWQQEEEV